MRTALSSNWMQAIRKGVSYAVMAPFACLLLAAASNYEWLRDLLLRASTHDMTGIVAVLWLAGFALGLYLHWPDSRLEIRPKAEAWFNSALPGGETLSTREAKSLERLPRLHERNELLAMARKLSEPGTFGSDLLDHKILKMLGLTAGLRPTQSHDDAIRLLALRYAGVKSKLDWGVDVDALGGLHCAYVVCRPTQPIKPDGLIDTSRFHRCIRSFGATPALAITAAVLERESMVYSAA